MQAGPVDPSTHLGSHSVSAALGGTRGSRDGTLGRSGPNVPPMEMGPGAGVTHLPWQRPLAHQLQHMAPSSLPRYSTHPLLTKHMQAQDKPRPKEAPPSPLPLQARVRSLNLSRIWWYRREAAGTHRQTHTHVV